MAEYTFRSAREKDRADIISFMNAHWGSRHPLVNRPEWFDFYYSPGDGTLRFALAECGGQLTALAGYIPASSRPGADIWVSIWIADKAFSGSGLELMAALPTLTGAGSVSCNNIRPVTRPFYEFLGYATGRVGHFYRLAAKEDYAIAVLEDKTILPVSGAARLVPVPNAAALLAAGFTPPEGRVPYKDTAYLARRYFAFPHQVYDIFLAYPAGESAPAALIAARTIPCENSAVLRIADYVGENDFLPQLGTALDALLQASAAEYADFYCAGIPAATLAGAGFCEREETGPNILPHYLTPLLQENTELYYFTNKPEHFVLCKADGDQDRPNLPER